MMLQNLAFVFSLIILTSSFPNGSTNLFWLNHLTKYIEKDSKISQVLLIIDDDNNVTTKHYIIDNVVEKLKFVPHNVIGLKNATLQYAKKMSQKTQFKDLQSTTLILTIIFLEKRNFSKVFELNKFLIPLHAYESRTKCLTIISAGFERFRYKKFLEQMWLNDFLDFTIVEISQNRSENIKIHWYNPFTNVYKVKNYSERKQQIFVNKLQNMNDFEMKIGTFNLPPFVFVKRNSTGHPIQVSGPTVKIIREFAKKMHFKIVEVPSQEEWFGWISKSKNNNNVTSLIEQLLNKKIRYITNWGTYLEKSIFPRTKVIDFDRFCALIPTSEKSKWNIRYQWSFIYFVIFILILKMVTSIIKFDDQFWSFDYILRGTLGFTVPGEPRNIDVKMTMDPMIIVDTLKKLNETNLTPMMRQSYALGFSRSKEQIIRDLVKKTLILMKEEECVEILIQYKNVIVSLDNLWQCCSLKSIKILMVVHK
ncbi:uncharacterized protein LOC127284023 isoform X2 [Leptopilina boulardi]|uniref:uncharacterized protein LOC127284023 isoform X2 n=1 Tax=Leptopilina boulardi TaxID=63433 RepID=UPI0021F571B7|nr:uncharacterized protein LOC127284023 isoform X2 [Leptopilina boulardi]